MVVVENGEDVVGVVGEKVRVEVPKSGAGVVRLPKTPPGVAKAAMPRVDVRVRGCVRACVCTCVDCVRDVGACVGVVTSARPLWYFCIIRKLRK